MDKFDRKIPYNDLQLLPPKADIETKTILRKTISAGRVLAQLKGVKVGKEKLYLNQQLLEILAYKE